MSKTAMLAGVLLWWAGLSAGAQTMPAEKPPGAKTMPAQKPPGAKTMPAEKPPGTEPIGFEKPAGVKTGMDDKGRNVHWKMGLETNVLKFYPVLPEKRRPGGSPVDVNHEFQPRKINTLEDWKKARAEIHKAVTKYFGRLPTRKMPLEHKVEQEADGVEFKVRHVTLAYDGEHRGRICLLIPKAAPAPAPVLLMYDAYREGQAGIERLCGELYSRAYALHMVREIAIWGHVYGAEIAQFAAAADERIAAVVASNSWMTPTGHFGGEYYDPPFWADGRSMGGIIQLVERASPAMYQSRTRVNYRPLPFLTQELVALIAPRPYLGINHFMGAGKGGDVTSQALRNCVLPVWGLYGRPKGMELIEHRWGTNEPANAREFTVDFLLRAMCGIHPGKCPQETAKKILADLRAAEKAKRLLSARLAGWWKCKPATKDLAKLVTGQDVLLRRVAAKALQRIGDMEELFKHVKHKDPMVRLCVVEAISMHGTEDTYEVLAEDETDPDKWVKEAKWQTLQVNPWE